jgi:hypothetical protein
MLVSVNIIESNQLNVNGSKIRHVSRWEISLPRETFALQVTEWKVAVSQHSKAVRHRVHFATGTMGGVCPHGAWVNDIARVDNGHDSTELKKAPVALTMCMA